MSGVPQTQWILYVYKSDKLVHMQGMATAPAVPHRGARFGYKDKNTGAMESGIVDRVEQIADPETNSVTVYVT
jgi:hypothetical protein